MALFANPKKKLARDTAHHWIGGHVSLLAYWALEHAGVFAAMQTPEVVKEGGLDPAAHAQATNMSPPVLKSLLDYLVRQEFLLVENGRYRLAPLGEAMLEFDDGLLEHVHAHQSVMGALEHLLARLRVSGQAAQRKYDAFLAAQAQRYAPEIFPAVEDALGHAGAKCVLDLNCGGGELLIQLATAKKELVGVGLCPDALVARQANARILKAQLDKRLIAIPTAAVDALTDTRRAFDRAGISPQLWERFDCLLAIGLFSEQLAQDRQLAQAAWRAIPRAFSGASLVVVEACAGPRLARNHYAAEFELLAQIAGTSLLTQEQWAENLLAAGLRVTQQVAMNTDGACLFVCKPSGRVAAAPVAAKPAEVCDARR